MNILIVGGTGFVGHQVKEALLKLGEKYISSPAHLDLDLTKNETYNKIDSADIIICCAEAELKSKVSFIQYCLDKSKIFIETSAHPETIQGIIERFKKNDTKNGTLLVGMGVFPGLSNLLVKAAIQNSKTKDISITVSTSPFSGAGLAMAKLMVDLLAKPSWQRIDGNQVSRNDCWSKISVWFPESLMLGTSLQLNTVRTYFQPIPKLLAPILVIKKKLGIFQLKCVQHLSLEAILFLRGRLLRNKPTSIQILVEALPNHQRLAMLTASDGVKLAAESIAVAAQILFNEKLTGVFFPEDIFSLEQIKSQFTVKKLMPWNVETYDGK